MERGSMGEQGRRSRLRPSFSRIGRWQPSIILFDTSRSATALAKDRKTGKSALVTYLKPAVAESTRAKLLFLVNAERIKKSGERFRMCKVDGAHLLIQKFQDQMSLAGLFENLNKSGKRMPERILCRILYSISSKTIKLIRGKVHFEFHPESITICRNGRIGLCFALPDRGYKLFAYQIPNLLVSFISGFSGSTGYASVRLKTLFSYPTLQNLKQLRSEAAGQGEMNGWLKTVLNSQEVPEEDPELELRQLQRMTTSPQQPVTRSLDRQVRQSEIELPAPSPAKPKTIWGVYVSLAGLLFMIVMAAAWEMGESPSPSNDKKPGDRPPLLVLAPDALYSRTGKTVATVLILVDKNGSVISHKFQRATPDQVATYNESIRLMKFQSSYTSGKQKSAWLIINLPLESSNRLR
ncbi:hypothetical protein L0156_03000 [bacterium]|nr:hypothetical protein [bacterium]